MAHIGFLRVEERRPHAQGGAGGPPVGTFVENERSFGPFGDGSAQTTEGERRLHLPLLVHDDRRGRGGRGAVGEEEVWIVRSWPAGSAPPRSVGCCDARSEVRAHHDPRAIRQPHVGGFPVQPWQVHPLDAHDLIPRRRIEDGRDGHPHGGHGGEQAAVRGDAVKGNEEKREPAPDDRARGTSSQPCDRRGACPSDRSEPRDRFLRRCRR